jgi:hypothetical protein
MLAAALVCIFPNLLAPMMFDGAHVIGAYSIDPVQVVDGREGERTYIEWTASGIPQVTVVLPDGTAVHSRHSIIRGEFVESQTRGICTPWRSSPVNAPLWMGVF